MGCGSHLDALVFNITVKQFFLFVYLASADHLELPWRQRRKGSDINDVHVGCLFLTKMQFIYEIVICDMYNDNFY